MPPVSKLVLKWTKNRRNDKLVPPLTEISSGMGKSAVSYDNKGKCKLYDANK